jgi:cell division septation protein DedD
MSSASIPTSVLATNSIKKPVADNVAVSSHGVSNSPNGVQPVKKLNSSARMVQVMALSNASDAESMSIALKRHGYNVSINHEAQDKRKSR